MLSGKVFFRVKLVGEVVHQGIGLGENHLGRTRDWIRPVGCDIWPVEGKDGVVDHFVDLTHDRVVEIAVQVGMDLK